MRLQVDEELMNVCREILSHNKNEEEWAAIESDDMFQSENYEGGYDATEADFCFSYYDPLRKEYWFQLNLDELKDISLGRIKEITVSPAKGC